MKKIISILLFLILSCQALAQKNSFGFGVSAYNFLNDGYGYNFNQFSKVFWSGYSNPLGVSYMIAHFNFFYEYKIDSSYSIKLANDVFTREYRNPKAFLEDEIGLSSRVFSTTTLSVNRILLAKYKKSLLLRGSLGVSFRHGSEFFHKGVFPPEYLVYTVGLLDFGYALGGEMRYNIHKNVFLNANVNFLDYVFGAQPNSRVSIFNKSWTVFQASFSVGVNF
jgi:hypothetical protein